MRKKWKNLLFQLIGFELLAPEFIRLFAKGVYNFKADLRKRLVAWAVKAVILLLLLSFAQGALFFGLGALALYLNALLGSSYQGFLFVAGGCVALLLLFWLLSRVRR